MSRPELKSYSESVVRQLQAAFDEARALAREGDADG